MRPSRLTIADARGQGMTLRVTRHPEQRKVVLSHWRDGVCVASTPIELAEVSSLIGVLADALGDGLGGEVTPTAGAARPHGLLGVLRDWLRPKLAQISELRLPGEREGERQVG